MDRVVETDGACVPGDMGTPRWNVELADQELVSALSEQFRPALARYFHRRRLPERDVEDAIQEVFVRLSKRQGLAGMANVSGYLFETAASVAIDHRRRANARSSQSHEQYEEQLHAVADHSTDAVIEGKQSLELLRAGLLELPERTRNAFLLVRLEQMRYAEVAARLGISVSAVEKHVLKAVTHLTMRLNR
ncbi:sigma-70 family RNA polymerase sigma factor [Steroidobacter sp. S1-65]|uniref:Sigma-70 family RNA polymerase sigma factor n=2 Tax=Steroidobacter gossypii TaxID=2805490 RepID=A0ABS1X0G4_9GAMM|nr:sigma-70 family RNA polymerase sigma factor [Steroidobacter gossypii]